MVLDLELYLSPLADLHLRSWPSLFSTQGTVLDRRSWYRYDDSMHLFAESIQCSGEITERSELLNGTVQLSLDGEMYVSEDHWEVEIVFAWSLGRVGAVSISEGELIFGCGQQELIAILDRGFIEVDPDGGEVDVSARFKVDDFTGLDLALGASIGTHLTIGAERWHGEISGDDRRG